MLDLIDETLRQMTFLVPVFVVFSTFFTILPGWDDHFGIHFHNQQEEIFGVIGAIGNQALKFQVNHQSFGLRNVMPLASRQAKTQGVAQRIDTHVDFGAEPAPAATEGLFRLATVFFEAPAAQGWARITLLSRIRFSMSGSVTKC